MFQDILEKLKTLIDKLIAKLDKKTEEKEPPVAEPAPTTPPVSTPTPVQPAPQQPAPQAPGIDPTGDPAQTDLSKLKVTSFLWKPVSDTNPVVSVVTISTDTIRSDDLRLRIFDKNGKLISGTQEKNKYSNGRGNGPLPGHKYARINFKYGKTDKEFSKLAPIKVTFVAVVAGKEYPVTIMGKDSMIIKDPTKRIDLK